MSPKAKDKDLTFEKAMTRLEAIVEEMEAGTLSLDKAMAVFEEGNTLVKFCTSKLNEVERKIEVLVKQGSTIRAESFEEDGDDAPSSPDSGGAPSDALF